MLLQRNIIYLLTLICLSSFAGLFTPWQVVVNVCTGLFSGAFIGVITSIAQYNKIRNDYFRSLYMLLTEYYKVFRDDENLITQSVDYLRQHSFDEIVRCNNFSDFKEVNNSLIERYRALQGNWAYNEYVSLNPFEQNIKYLLKKINHEMWFARGEVIHFHHRLYEVTAVEDACEIFECISDRTLLYQALLSGIECICYYAEELGTKLKITKSDVYIGWLSKAEYLLSVTHLNKERVIYGSDYEDDDNGFDDE